jgi:PBP1b-binding outer membrane lipoprotein LpoB
VKNKKIVALSLGTIAVLSLVGCSSDVKEETAKKAEPTVDVDKVEKQTTEKVAEEAPVDMEISLEEAIYANALDMEEENVEGYMDDIVIAEDQVEMTKQALTQLFEAIDATYQITKINVLEETNTTAKVEVTQVTKAVEKTEGFQDNETTTIHTMEFVDGKWKFVTSEVKNVKYL